MPSSSALSDALIGRRSYEDPQVLIERDILLGDDATAISRTRRNLISSIKRKFSNYKRAAPQED